jgi:SecD/SecF fusion protein
MPILALLLFGGTPGSTELTDFAFALLIGVASGAYSSIFIASPVLTHWKEREPQYRHRRERIEAELGYVPAYAATGADVEPTAKRPRRTGRLTTPDADKVSAAEFEQMKRDIRQEEAEPSRRTSTLTKRLAHTTGAPAPAAQKSRQKPAAAPRTESRPQDAPARTGDAAEGTGNGAPQTQTQAPTPTPTDGEAQPSDEVRPAPDVAENEGVAPTGPKRPAKPRNRRHGRRR